MFQALICDAIRTPFGRYGGALSSVRVDDLGAIPLRALMARNSGVDWSAVTDVIAQRDQPSFQNVAVQPGLQFGRYAPHPGMCAREAKNSLGTLLLEEL